MTSILINSLRVPIDLTEVKIKLNHLPDKNRILAALLSV